MNAPEPVLQCLVLTEDSGKHSHKVLSCVLRKIFQFLEPGLQTQLVDFLPANDDARDAMSGTNWKDGTEEGRYNRVTLVQTIATALRSKLRQVVFFHVDADQCWTADRPAENERKFDALIRDAVIRRLTSPPLRGSENAMPEEDAQRLLERLILVLPFWSVESWLYQSTDHAISLCHTHYAGRDAALFASWGEHRAELDEFEQPKDRTCLADRHNHDLAARITVQLVADVNAVGKSMAALVASCVASTTLVEGLAVAAENPWG